MTAYISTFHRHRAIPFLTMSSSTADAWNATKYNATGSFVYSDAYTAPVLDLLNAQSGEKIVDFGCGTGELTKLLTNIVGVGGTVLGLDASKNMVRSPNLLPTSRLPFRRKTRL